MLTIRVITHSLLLVLADLAGIGGGALAAFWIPRMPNQVWLQVPIAVLLSVGFFLVWLIAVRTLRIKALWPVGTGESWTWLAASLLWAPLVFVPLHYFTQGYLTSLGNVVALAFYQLPVNALALAAGRLVWKSLAPGANQPRQ